ncbi:MAG: DM13 domain-containing protein [Gemmatimonadota bacterium]
MSLSLRAGFTAGLLLAAAALPLAAQDSTMMKKDAMGPDKMAPVMMDRGMMAPHGMFAGAHDHRVSGSYAISEKDGKQSLQLSTDFALDGAPDPYIVLSADEMGSGAKTLNLGALKRKQGTSSFAIPAGTDLAQYSRVLVWCKKYNVTLGTAELAAGGAMMHN